MCTNFSKKNKNKLATEYKDITDLYCIGGLFWAASEGTFISASSAILKRGINVPATA